MSFWEPKNIVSKVWSGAWSGGQSVAKTRLEPAAQSWAAVGPWGPTLYFPKEMGPYPSTVEILVGGALCKAQLLGPVLNRPLVALGPPGSEPLPPRPLALGGTGC
jgi:hypothetical protein